MSKSIVKPHLRLVQPLFQTGQVFDPKDKGSMYNQPHYYNQLVPFVCSLIRQNARHQGDCYVLWAEDLDVVDQQLYLSRLISAQDYEWIMQNEIRKAAAIKDYMDDMQYFINQYIDDVYREDMEEAGLIWNRNYEDHEGHWARR